MTEIEPGAAVGFVGLGRMATPMATRLAEAGYRVQGYDVSEQAVRSWAERAEGACPAASLDAAAAGAAAVILMLPDSAVVRGVLAGLVLSPGAVVVDMSSSEPLVTRELARRVTLDMRIALGLAEAAGTPAALSAAATSLWAEAAQALPADADHTEIARRLEG
jgi:3-hydroxyisobutyrate dehydrogenase